MKKTSLNASRIAAMAAFAVFATGCGGDGLVEEFAKLGTDADRVKFLREKLKYTVPVNGNNEPITVDTLKELKNELEKAGATAADKEKAIKAKLGIVVKIGAGSGKTDAQIFQEALNAKFPKATYPDFYKRTSEDADVAEITTKLVAGATATTNLATAQPKADNFDVWNTGITAVATGSATASTNFATEWAGLKAATTAANTNVALAAFDAKCATLVGAEKTAQIAKAKDLMKKILAKPLAGFADGNARNFLTFSAYLMGTVYNDLVNGAELLVLTNTNTNPTEANVGQAIATALNGSSLTDKILPLGSYILYSKAGNAGDAALYKTTAFIKALSVTTLGVDTTANGANINTNINTTPTTALKIVKADGSGLDVDIAIKVA